MSSTSGNIGSGSGSVNPDGDREPFLDGLDEADVDEPHDRRYRRGPVRAVPLSESLTEAAGGPLTRKNTPRLDLLAAARAAFLQRKTDANESDALRFDSGACSVRRAGTHVKSIQGHAEDVWRRIYKRPLPEGDPLEDEEFHRLYRRMQASLRRSTLLEDHGSAIEASQKKVRDEHGKRWGLSPALEEEAESGPEATAPTPFIRCTGEPLEKAPRDVWARIERRVAREENLHRTFTHAITAAELTGRRWEAEARRFERRQAREGSDRPRFRTIGQWRPETLGRGDRHRQAARVPWIVAEIDGRREDGKKDRDVSDRLARRLLRRLEDFGVDLSTVLTSYSGNASIHIRIPDGVVGCPIYQRAESVKESLNRFFDRLCGADDELRRAIDNACLRPSQLIRAIGSVHEKTGRRVVGCTADVFLERSSSFLFALSEKEFEYSPPESFPLPRRASFVPALAALLAPPPTASSSPSSDTDSETNVSQKGSGGKGEDPPGRVLDRIKSGVREGEPWGPDVGRPCAVGRNWAALFVAHNVLRRCPDRSSAEGALKQWNKRNVPPLPKDELEAVFERAWEYHLGEV